MRNKLVRIVSQIFYISAELISANRGVWLGSVEFISAISEFLRKFADFICAFPDVFTFYFFYTTVNVLFSVFGMLGKKFVYIVNNFF